MKQIPNLLTLLRLFLIPIYCLVFYMDHPQALHFALFIFITASLTDVLDGYLARKFDVVSKFGIVADPFADKLMQVAVLYTLYDIGRLEVWFFWVILVKEMLQIGLGLWMVSLKPRIIVPANVFGKTTTILVFLTIILAVFRFPAIFWLQVVVAILGTITFTQYAFQFYKKYMAQKHETTA